MNLINKRWEVKPQRLNHRIGKKFYFHALFFISFFFLSFNFCFLSISFFLVSFKTGGPSRYDFLCYFQLCFHLTIQISENCWDMICTVFPLWFKQRSQYREIVKIWFLTYLLLWFNLTIPISRDCRDTISMAFPILT